MRELNRVLIEGLLRDRTQVTNRFHIDPREDQDDLHSQTSLDQQRPPVRDDLHAFQSIHYRKLKLGDPRVTSLLRITDWSFPAEGAGI